MPVPEKLLTPSEVSGILGVTEGTLTVWRSTGRYALDYVKVGGKVMYTKDAVNEFIDRRSRD